MVRFREGDIVQVVRDSVKFNGFVSDFSNQEYKIYEIYGDTSCLLEEIGRVYPRHARRPAAVLDMLEYAGGPW